MAKRVSCCLDKNEGVIVMKKMSEVLVGVAAVLAVVPAFGLTTDKIPEKSYANVLTINVESGTQTIAEALAAQSLDLTALTGNAYDKLEKTGAGKLKLDQNISTFTGDIYVEGGYLSATDPTSLGAESGTGDTSFIVVREGAQLDYVSSSQGQWSTNNKTVYLAGTGPEGGNGYALQFSGTGNVNPQSGSCGWGKNLILTGDATLGRVTVSWPDMWSAAGIYFNGHCLTMDFGTTANRFRLYGKDSNPDSSAYIKSSGEVYMKTFQPAGSADNTFTIGKVNSIRMQCNPSVWTWIVENGDMTRFLIDETGKQMLSPLVIQQGSLLVTNLEASSAYTFAEAISGAGGLRVSPLPAETPFELTLGAVNTFAGALTVENATLHANVCGAVPPEAPLVLSDATADLKVEAVLRLGAVTATGDNLIELSHYPAVASGLSVRDGTTRFSTTDRVPTVHTETGEIAPGLFYSLDNSTNYWTGGLEWKSTQVVTAPAHTNDIDNIVLSLDAANVYSQRTISGYYCYSGYIMNMTDAEVTWGFYVHPHARGCLMINGSPVFSGRSTTDAKYGTAKLKPGANTFLFKCVEADKRCGPYYAGSAGIDPLGGFAICKTDATSKSVATLTADDLELSPTDPGDGSLFRVANSAEEIAALGIKERKITVTDLSVASGAALDVGGRELIVTNLTGSGAISNYNRLTVVETLTGGTGSAAAGALTLNGGIVFAEGAKVVLDTTGMRSSTAYPLVSSATPIVGTPTLELTGPRADIGGTLQFSEDRTSLTFVPEQQGALILVR